MSFYIIPDIDGYNFNFSDGTGMVTLVVTIDVELLNIIEEKLQFVTHNEQG